MCVCVISQTLDIRGNVPLKLVTKRVHIYNFLSFSGRLIIYTKHEKIYINTFPNPVIHYILKWLTRNRDSKNFSKNSSREISRSGRLRCICLGIRLIEIFSLISLMVF